MWCRITIMQPFALHCVSAGLCYKVRSQHRLVCRALSLAGRIGRPQCLFIEHRERLFRWNDLWKKSIALFNFMEGFFFSVSEYSIPGILSHMRQMLPWFSQNCRADLTACHCEQMKGLGAELPAHSSSHFSNASHFSGSVFLYWHFNALCLHETTHWENEKKNWLFPEKHFKTLFSKWHEQMPMILKLDLLGAVIHGCCSSWLAT